MSRTYIPIVLRRQVLELAKHRCEYCLVHADDAAFEHEVDHIVAEKHRGVTDLGNLAYACFACNRNKGSDLGSLAQSTGVLTRFFNPRTILGFNAPQRIEERELLIALGTWPPVR